ncbi:hypothetical protein GCM10020220_085890 [Nonomuraea rubra]
MAATVPIVISGGIEPAPRGLLTIMALVLVFAVGLVAMARYMEKPGAFYTYIIAGLAAPSGSRRLPRHPDVPGARRLAYVVAVSPSRVSAPTTWAARTSVVADRARPVGRDQLV